MEDLIHFVLECENCSCVSIPELLSEGILFKVFPINAKKPCAQFMIPLMDMELRHSLRATEKLHSFTEPDSGIVVTFKAYINGPSLLRDQLLAKEDDEKLMAIQDLLEMAKKSDSQLHTYLMDEKLLLALLDLTLHWLHDAMFSIELAALIPQTWRAILNSPFHQCVQYFSLDNESDCDFFEYFVDSMFGNSAITPTPTNLGLAKSPSTSVLSPRDGSRLSSPIFFNRERKLQMINIFTVFLRKSVPHSFRASLVTQVSRLIALVGKYLTATELKSSSPKAAQEEFLIDLLNATIFSSANLSRAPHALLLPTFAALLNDHSKISTPLVVRILLVLKELPAPTSNAIISDCNLVSILDSLTEHENVTVAKYATYNWSKYMMFLTTKPTTVNGKQVPVTISLDLSESCVTSES
jgi:hypothetical protein